MTRPHFLRAIFVLFSLTAWTLCIASGLGAQKKKDAEKSPPVLPPEPRIDRTYPKANPLLEITGHDDWINRVAGTPDGKSLITAGRDKSLRVWDIATGKETKKIDLPAAALVLAVSPDGSNLATAAGKWNKEKSQWTGEINIYELKTGKLSSTLQGHTEAIQAVAFNPKGKALVSVSDDGTAKIWDITAGKDVQTLKGHSGAVLCASYSPDGKWIATGGDDKTVKIWDGADGKEVATLKGPKRGITAVAFTNDNSQLAAASLDETVSIWKTADWGSPQVLKAEDGVLTVAFSPDGTKLACGGWERVVQIWDVPAGKELGGMAGHALPISSVMFNANGDRVVSASLDRTVRIWDVASAKPGIINKKKDENKKEDEKKMGGKKK